jgi:hypothetical protein
LEVKNQGLVLAAIPIPTLLPLTRVVGNMYNDENVCKTGGDPPNRESGTVLLRRIGDGAFKLLFFTKEKER